MTPDYDGSDPWNTGENNGVSLGGESEGTLTIDSGSIVNSLYAGFWGSQTNATATVTGPGSAWHITEGMHIGHAGTLIIEDDGVVSVGGNTQVKYQGSLNFDGGTLNTTSLSANQDTISGTGTINTNGLASDIDLTINAATGLQQQLMLNNLPGQDITINLDLSNPTSHGNLGTRGSSLLIADGQVVTSQQALIHGGPDGAGAATVIGAGTAWNMTSGLTVGDTGIGTLDIGNASTVNVTYTSYIDTPGYEPSSTANVTGPGSVLNSRNLVVDTGTLNIENQGRVNISETSYIGHDSSSIGVATVTGAGSTWNSQQLFVGDEGLGTLNIENAGVANVLQDTWVGVDDPASTINLNNGVFNTSGLLASPSNLRGTGTINAATAVSDMDLVFDSSTGLRQQLILNTLPGQDVTLNLDASSPDNQGALGAGYQGTGTLTIKDDLSISSGAGIIGYGWAADGTVTVKGDGSTWKSDHLTVGHLGKGTLNIQDGGTVITNQLVIGIWSSQTPSSTVNLAGGTLDLNGGSITSEHTGSDFSFTGGELKDVSHISFAQTPSMDLTPFTQDGGTFSPGDPVGVTEILRGYAVNGGTVRIDMGGADNTTDQIMVLGGIDINPVGTTLDLNAVGDLKAGVYLLMQTQGYPLTGNFQTVVGLQRLGDGAQLIYGAQTLHLLLTGDFLFADLNQNGSVGIDDLNIVLDHWNQNVTPGDILAGDLNHDGFVGIDDLTAVLGQWNQGTPPAVESLASVPEPTCALCMMGLTGLSCRRTTRPA